MKNKRSGWEKPRKLASEYVWNHEGEPGALEFKKVVLIARKWLIGFKGELDNLDHHAFEVHVSDLIRSSKKPPVSSWPALEVLNRKIEEKRLGADVLQADVLIDLSGLINRVGGIERFEMYLNVVKSIKDLD